MSTLRDVQRLASDPDIKPLLTQKTLDHKGEVVERPKQYIRKLDRDQWQEDIDRDEKNLKDPLVASKIVNAGRIKQQIDRRKINLAQQTPPPLTASQRDKLAQLEKAAREYAIDGMVSKQEIALPAGEAIGRRDRIAAWNRTKKNAVLIWKNTQKLLHPEDKDRELTNFERYRPDRPRLSGETSMIGGGKMFAGLGAAYDQIDWSKTPEREAEIAESLKHVKIKSVTEAARKAKGDGGKVYTCEHTECEGQIFSGQIGKARWSRHMKRTHGEVPREKTHVALPQGGSSA